MEFTFTSLGISAAGPFMGRWPSSNVLTLGGNGFLIDCGEGTQIALQRQKIGWSKLDFILISHFHGDHIFGLPGLLTSWSLLGRQSPLYIFSPPGLQHILEAIFDLGGAHISYPLHWHVVEPENAPAVIWEDKQFSIESLPLVHRAPCVGYLVKEKLRDRGMKKSAIEAYNIPFSEIKAIKRGGNFQTNTGEIIPNAELTKDPPEIRSFAYCVDTEYAPAALVPTIQGVDILVHEATFLHELIENAKKNGHSTALQAGQLAKAAEVGCLVLTHFSSRYDDLTPLLEEAKSVFSNTHLAGEGKQWEVPLVKRQ